MIIADTSGLMAGLHLDETDHDAVVDFVESARELIVVSPFVLAELDYLVSTRLGLVAELEMIREMARGSHELAHLTDADLEQCADVVERYGDQDIGLADASLVVLAKRYDTRKILTLDHRHFDVLRPLQGGRFKVLPN